MKMPEQSPPVQRAGTVAADCRPTTSQTSTVPEAHRYVGSGISPSQGPAVCYGLQGEAQQMCLSMFS